MGRSAKTIATCQPWVLVGLIGMLAAATSSGLKPWAAAIAGGYLPADLAADAAAARLFVQKLSPYGPVIRDVHMDLTGLPLAATLPYFPHPPFSLIISLPLAFMSFHAGAALWFAVTMALVFTLAVLIHKAATSPNMPWLGAGPICLLLCAWPPVLYNLEKGQWSVLVAVLLALAWHAVRRGEVRNGALLAALAASVKVFPVVLGAYFLVRSVRAAGWFVATGIVLAAVPLLWIGFASLPAFIHESRMNLPYWESFPLVMFSIHGAITRALVGGQWAHPFLHAPFFARLLEAAVAAAILGIALWTTLRARRGTSITRLLHGLAGHAAVAESSRAWTQRCASGIANCGARPNDRDQPNWHRWAWAVAVILVSIPNQTVWRYASPPTGALEGLPLPRCPVGHAAPVRARRIADSPSLSQRPIGSRSSGKLRISPAAPFTARSRSVGAS